MKLVPYLVFAVFAAITACGAWLFFILGAGLRGTGSNTATEAGLLLLVVGALATVVLPIVSQLSISSRWQRA